MINNRSAYLLHWLKYISISMMLVNILTKAIYIQIVARYIWENIFIQNAGLIIVSA